MRKYFKVRFGSALVVLFSVMLSLPVHAQSSIEPRFADLPWLSSKDLVKKQLVNKGYKFVQNSDDGDLTFSGVVIGNTATIYTMFNQDGQLLRSVVVFQDKTNPYTVYKGIKSKLEDKYSLPVEVNTLKSVTYEILVISDISNDTSKLYSHWDGKNKVTIDLQLGKPYTGKPEVYCSLYYDHPLWELERVRRETKSDL